MHGTSFHSVLGYKDSKHPFLGTGVRDMVVRQSSLCFDGRCGAICGRVGAGTGPVGAGTPGWAGAGKDAKSTARRFAATVEPKILVKRPHDELEYFITPPLVRDGSTSESL